MTLNRVATDKAKVERTKPSSSIHIDKDFILFFGLFTLQNLDFDEEKYFQILIFFYIMIVLVIKQRLLEFV